MIPVEAKNAAAATAVPPPRIAHSGRRLFITTSARRHGYLPQRPQITARGPRPTGSRSGCSTPPEGLACPRPARPPFGASGAGQGDNSDLARLAIDANPATAWHTDWHTSAHFGNLYPGTGLLVDMGRPVTITAARITLGNRHGDGLELRVGAAPALAGLPPAAQVANAGSVIRLRLPTPAHGWYVLIWFTSLPPDSAGTFQARVYDLQLEGRA